MYRHDPVISFSPRALISGEGIQLGLSVTGREVSIATEALERHLLVLGKTGTGKSNLLRQIISRIVETGSGSVVIFDPHGSLGISTVCSYPDKSLIISPSGIADDSGIRSIKLNAISLDESGERNHLAAGWIKDAFSSEGVFSQGTWGPRLEVVFSSILQELMRKDRYANLADLLELLLDNGKIRRFISETDNAQLKSFLKMQVSDWRGWNQYVTSSINKLLPLLNNNGIRNLISGRRDTLNLMDFLESGGRILIPEIWKDAVPDDSFKVITTLLLLKLWLQRLDSAANGNQVPVYLVFDEAQLVPPNVLDRLLREGRKFGFRIILSTQFLGSGYGSLSETIRGNIGNVISFSLLENDSRLVASNFFSGTLLQKVSEVLKSQALHRGVIWSQDEKGVAGPLSFKPHLNELKFDNEIFRNLRERSIKEYGTTDEDTADGEEKTDLHEFLIVEFQKFLQKKSLATDRNVSTNGIFPDLQFVYNDTTIYVEVEVSDLLNFRRISEKIMNYASRKLIFITPPDSSSALFHQILAFLVKNDLKIHQSLTKRTTDILSTISILEYNKGFLFLAAGKLRQLRMDQLLRGSFLRSLDEYSYGEIRMLIYSRMVSHGTFSIEFPEKELGRIFGQENTSKARQFLIGNTPFITIQDLFLGKADDPQAE